MNIRAVVDDRHRQNAARAAEKIRRRLDSVANTPPSLQPTRRIAVTLRPREWEALLREAGR